MAQIFRRSANSFARFTLIVILLLLSASGAIAWLVNRSSYFTRVGEALPQPVPFSHEHHVGGLGIDCRYCHQTVEVAAFAGMPPTHTCMSCHSQIWANSTMLEPVRASYRENVPLAWTRVYDVPDFVYFNHSIHVRKGVGCVTCHGRIDRMPLTMKATSLHMAWCLDCHRQPEKYVRPRERVFDMAWRPQEDQLAMGSRLVKEYGIRRLIDCYTCHR
jgi:hypothetical protein